MERLGLKLTDLNTARSDSGIGADGTTTCLVALQVDNYFHHQVVI